MYSSPTLLQDVLFSKLHYPHLYYGLSYTPEFGSVMLSLLDIVDPFENIITYMLLLKADYTTDIDFDNVDLTDPIKLWIDKSINRKLHHIIFYRLSFTMKKITYYKHKNSKLILSTSSVVPIHNIILANLFVKVALINSDVRAFGAPILSYITLLI